MRARLFWALGVLAIRALGGYAVFQLSPWPSALSIRAAFDKDANLTSEALARHVPPGGSPWSARSSFWLNDDRGQVRSQFDLDQGDAGSLE